MKTLAIAGAAAVAAFYLLPVDAGAFSAPSRMKDIDGVHIVIDSSGRTVDVVGNANSCAPFEPKAVWGQTMSARPIGYHCYNPQN